MAREESADTVLDMQDEVRSTHHFLERRQRWNKMPMLLAVAALTLLPATVVVCSRWASALAAPKTNVFANEVVSLAPVRSGNVIKEWQADGGASAKPKDEHEPREMDIESATAVVRCCPASGSGKGMTPEPCSGNVTWQEALDLCCRQPGDYRLCTKEELDADVAEATGCDYDKFLVWTRRSSSTYFQTHGRRSVCRLDASDQCCDARGTAQIHYSTDQSACEEKCRTTDACTGYESTANDNYCEIWTQPITHYELRDNRYECKRKVGACSAKPS